MRRGVVVVGFGCGVIVVESVNGERGAVKLGAIGVGVGDGVGQNGPWCGGGGEYVADMEADGEIVGR